MLIIIIMTRVINHDAQSYVLTVTLNNQDQQICSYLEEKLNIYAKLGDMSGFEDVQVEPHLLIKPDSGETPHVASLLVAALKEGECTHHPFPNVCFSQHSSLHFIFWIASGFSFMCTFHMFPVPELILQRLWATLCVRLIVHNRKQAFLTLLFYV